MKITVFGGGPSGLYLGLLARKHLGAEVTVFEQNPRDATYGFGIVLADRGLDRMKAADEESYHKIMDSCFVSRHRIVSLQGDSIFIEGGGYGAAIARLRLLQILQECCENAGVTVHYDHHLDTANMPDADLIVGADGVNSALRRGFKEEFGETSYLLTNKLAWYGAKAHFPYPILSFKKHERGHFWCVGYAYTVNMGTFVAECAAEAWEDGGLKDLTDDERTAFAEELFAEELSGQKLISNKSTWFSLPVTRVKNWSVGNKVLIGDALHNAHPSIGSGTRIAMEDSIALLNALEKNPDVPSALAAFRADRGPTKQKLIEAAEKSFTWYEEIGPRLDGMSTPTLAFDYLMRTGRIDEQRLIGEFPEFVKHYSKE